VDRSAIEDLFERNADMRLLELRHSDSGRTSGGAVRHPPAGFGAETNVAPPVNVPLANAPRLRVDIVAAPRTGVIPGALIGIAIDVFNDGTAPAPESKLVLSLPIEAEFRNGTLRVDGREVQAPDRLFGDGLPVARLPGGTSSKIVFQLHVLPGLNPLYLQPRLQTNGVPVVGTPGISIKRAAVPGTRTSAEPERPFYELDPEEHAADEAASAVPILPPVEPPPTATPLAAPTAPERGDEPPAPKRARRASAPAPEPAAIPTVTETVPPPKPARLVPASEERMSRYRSLGANDIAVLTRLFSGDDPGVIAHFVLIATLACNEADDGSDTTGYGAFLRADGEQLGRAIVLARLGKPIDYRVQQASLDALDLPWQPTPPPTTTPRRSPRRLRRDLSETECRAITSLIAPSQRDSHLRLRIALLALAGATIEGTSRARADECVGALASYRSAVLAWLIPLCVASMTNTAPTLPQPPANVNVAGRRVVTALASAYNA
jgi:hypothetical protein